MKVIMLWCLTIVSNFKSHLALLFFVLILIWLSFNFSLGQTSPYAATAFLVILFTITISTSRLINFLSNSTHPILLSLTSALAIIYLCEALLFYSDPKKYLPQDGTLNGRQYTWGHEVVNNSLGFRERELPPHRLPGSIRLMVIGDSITWGVGVSTEDRFSGLLQSSFNADHTTRPLEIYNFSTGGGNTTDQLNVLKQHIDLVNPDLIIVGFNENDPELNIPQAQTSRQSISAFFEPWEKIGRQIYLGHNFSATRRATIAILDQLDQLPPLENISAAYRPNSVAWAEWQGSLASIKNISAEHSLPAPIFAALNLGTYTDRPTNYHDPDPLLKQSLVHFNQAQDIADKLGFITIDFRQEIATQLPNQVLAINQLDRHPTPALHHIYADKLYRTITNHLELD